MPQQDMTKSDSRRVQSSQVSNLSIWNSNREYQLTKLLQAKGGNDMSSNGFAARAQAAGDKHANSNNGNAGNGGYGAFGSGFGTSTSGGNAAQGKK
jgi:hypothetical protein